MKNFIILLLFLTQNLFAQNHCEIGTLHLEKTVCNDEGNFYVFINFEKANTSNKFLVLGNGKNYGTYHYEDLPVKIGPLKADCTTNYEFLVKDSEFQDCQKFVSFGKNCCASDCKFYIDSIHHVCHDLNLDLILFTNRIDKKSGKYKVKINNEVKGTFDFGVATEIPGVPMNILDPVIEIVACHIDTETCCDTFYYVNPCVCSMTEFKSQVFDCNPEDSVFSIKIGFTATMVGDSFIIGGNTTNYGTYSYDQLPVTITNLPFSNTTFYEFLVLDKNSTFCFGGFELGIVESCDFGCHITHPTVDVLPCGENDSFYVRLKFKENNTSFSGFNVRGNGVSYGHFEYGDRYYDIGPLPGNCETIYEFVVQDNENESCKTSIHLEKPVCCSDECFIREPGITEVCDGDKLISYILNFEHNQDSTKIFGLWANGVKVGIYHYSSLPLTLTHFPTPFPSVNFTIVDQSNENCRKEFTYVFECKKPENQACSIVVHNIERTECEDGNFFIFFSVGGENQGAHGFKVTSPNANINVQFQYGVARYKIGPFKGDCITKYSFLLQDLVKPDCKEDFALEHPVCCGGDCYIREVNIIKICNGEQLTGFVINFDHNQDSSQIFHLFANNVLIGNFFYGQLPLGISNTSFNNQTVVFKIVNQLNENCRKELSYTFNCSGGGGGDCTLKVETFEREECHSDGTFYIFFKLKSENAGNHGFKVFSSQNNFNQSFEYGQNSYKIGPFHGDCVTKYQFLIKDVAHPECQTEFGLQEPVCCNEACAIDNVHIVGSECIDGLMSVTLNFNHNHTSGSFILKLNGAVRGTYQYQDLPIIIRQLQPKATYKIIIQDVEKDCVEDYTFTTPECTTSAEETFFDKIKVYTLMEDMVVQFGTTPSDKTDIFLTDVLGRVLQASRADVDEFRMPMALYPSGLYLVTIQNGHYRKTFKVFRNR